MRYQGEESENIYLLKNKTNIKEIKEHTAANVAIFTTGMLTERLKQREPLNSPVFRFSAHAKSLEEETDPGPAEASQWVKLDPPPLC